jgi:hypothetical protein
VPIYRAFSRCIGLPWLNELKFIIGLNNTE